MVGFLNAASLGSVEYLLVAFRAGLREAGFVPDYAVVRRPDFSVPVDGEGGPQVALIAARLGRTRLIDNIEFEVREFDSPGRERRES